MSDPAPLDLAKRHFFDHLWDEGRPLVRVDARHPGVVGLPAHCADDPALTLRIAAGLHPPVTVDVDDERLMTVLSFGGRAHAVTIPWAAVWSIGDDLGEAGAMFLPVPEGIAVEPEPPTRPRLSLVD